MKLYHCLGNALPVTNPVFSFKAGVGYSIKVRRKLDHICFAITSCQGEAPITENPAANTNPEQQEIITAPLSVGINAILNPFADRVRFSVTTERAGNGSIEVFNMQGQKIKTVYSGFVPAGISYYGSGSDRSIFRTIVLCTSNWF